MELLQHPRLEHLRLASPGHVADDVLKVLDQGPVVDLVSSKVVPGTDEGSTPCVVVDVQHALLVPLKDLRRDAKEGKALSEVRRQRRKQAIPEREHHPTDLVLEGVMRVPPPEMRPLRTRFRTDHQAPVEPTDLPV